MVIGSIVVAIALLILGWTGEIVKIFLGNGELVSFYLLGDGVTLVLTGIRRIPLLFLLQLWRLHWWILL